MRERVGLVVALALIGLAAAEPRRAAAQEPFALSSVLGGASAETLTWWVQLATGHAPGEKDLAVQKGLALGPRLLGGILWAAQRDRLPLRGDPVTVLSCGVVLHTDIAVAQLCQTRQPDYASSGGLAYLHLGMASELVAVLRKRPSSDSFVRAWHVAVAAVLGSQQEVNVAPLFLERALALYPGDPRLLLLAGAAHELRASPRVQDAVDLGDARSRFGSAADNRRRAEGLYRRALERAPNDVEALVRLGRVLEETGRHAEALSAFESAARLVDAAPTGDAVDRPIVYLLCLFAGEVEESRRHLDAARRWFDRASSLYPRASSVLLARSRLELRAGNRDAAAAAVAAISRQAGANESDDPWRTYYCAGLARQADALLAALGAAISRSQ